MMEIPTRADCFRMLMSLLPRGRAWQTHEAAAAYSLDDPEVGEEMWTGSILQAFWWAISGIWVFAERACGTLYDEMFCDTVVVDRDMWLEEYGLPNSVDPYGEDFCAKARQASQGGDRPAVLAEVAALIGWSATFQWLKGYHPDYPGVRSTVLITVDPEASWAMPGVPRAGHNAYCGSSRLGLPDTSRLGAIFATIIPAHADIILEVA